jgi:hypothetical protein
MSPVHKLELLQNGLRIARELLQRLVGLLRVGDPDQLHLVELMLADHSPRVLAI